MVSEQRIRTLFAQQLLKQQAVVAEGHVSELERMTERQHEHAASMLLKLEASQEATQDAMGHRDVAEIALQMAQDELTSERHQFDRILTSRDIARAEVDRIVRTCRNECAGARAGNESLVHFVQLHQSELAEARTDNRKMEAFVLGMVGDTVPGPRVNPAVGAGTNSLVGAGSSTDWILRPPAARLRGVEESGSITPEAAHPPVPRMELVSFAPIGDGDVIMDDGDASVADSWNIFPDESSRDASSPP